MTGERRVKGGGSWVKPADKRVKAGDRAAIARDSFDNATGRASIANASADKRTVSSDNFSDRQANATDRGAKPLGGRENQTASGIKSADRERIRK